MKGPHDDELQQLSYWPMRGIFQIELINQINESDNYIYHIPFDRDTPSIYVNRVIEGDWAPGGYGNLQFMSHSYQ